jgi:hypothetical protein
LFTLKQGGHEIQFKKQSRSLVQHGFHDGPDLPVADIFYAYFFFCDTVGLAGQSSVEQGEYD